MTAAEPAKPAAREERATAMWKTLSAINSPALCLLPQV